MGWAIVAHDISLYIPVSGKSGEIYDRETHNRHIINYYPNR